MKPLVTIILAPTNVALENLGFFDLEVAFKLKYNSNYAA
jgi:hypothetical protein